MRWKVILITIFSLLFFLVSLNHTVFAQEAASNVYNINPRPTGQINYYEDKKLSYQDTEGLLTAGGWLVFCGFLFLEPEAVLTFWWAIRRTYDYLGSERLFQLINRLL